MGPSILGNTKGVFVYSHGAEYDYTLIYSYYVYQVPRQLKLSQSPRGTLQFSTLVELQPENVSPSVRVSVCHQKFSETALRIFFILHIQLGEHNRRRITEPDFS